jgi:very-short-patch-repair endonuclease
LALKAINELDEPIVATRNRRNPFIPTTWAKFSRARTFNDLFNESRLEETLWAGLKQLDIEHAVERQHEWRMKRRRYYLDFAVFCEGSNVDIEVDGDGFHLSEEAVKYDKERDRELTEAGWGILRFPPEMLGDLDTCLGQISETIARRGGVEGTRFVPQVVPTRPNNSQGRLL